MKRFIVLLVVLALLAKDHSFMAKTTGKNAASTVTRHLHDKILGGNELDTGRNLLEEDDEARNLKEMTITITIDSDGSCGCADEEEEEVVDIDDGNQ